MMNRSPELDKLFQALTIVQGAIKNPQKDMAGFNNNYKYAKLDKFIDVSQKLLADNGLSIVQLPGSTRVVEVTDKIKLKDGSIETIDIKVLLHTVHTSINHNSGQFMEIAMDIPAEKTVGMSFAQSIGAAITFARKYARGGACGVVGEDEDTDGQKEEETYKGRKEITQQKQKPLPQPKITLLQKNILVSELKDQPERMKKIMAWANITVLDNMSVDQYNEVIDRIRLEKEKADMDFLNGREKVA